MSQNKVSHTPGPWTVREHGDANHHFILQGNGHWLMVLHQNGEKSSVELDANASLVSAAPELLETLEGCMKALARMIDKHDPDSIEAEWIGHANDAIIKAKGDVNHAHRPTPEGEGYRLTVKVQRNRVTSDAVVLHVGRVSGANEHAAELARKAACMVDGMFHFEAHLEHDEGADGYDAPGNEAVVGEWECDGK